MFNPLEYPTCLKRPKRLTLRSEWLGHIPFAMCLVELLRPQVIVELGTYNGDSYCAFCQAVKTLGIGTRCYAVDTWHGDPQGGFYGPEVFEDLKMHHDPLYGTFSELIQETFDEALKRFEDGSVDILHIDGLHLYSAVKHDFNAWISKMSEKGVILFHDTEVREDDFGVWKLWEEIYRSYPYFEFTHSHGLGVLGVGSKLPDGISKLLNSKGSERENIRRFFAELGCRFFLIRQFELRKKDYESRLKEKEQELSALYNSLSWKITAPLRWMYAKLLESSKR